MTPVRSAAESLAKRGVKLALLGPALVTRERRPGLFALIYHRVGAGQDREMDLPAAVFEAHMRHVRERFEAVGLREGVRRLEAGERPERDLVAVTFDDGYREVHTHAWPVLRALGIPATLFLPTGFLEGELAAPIRPGAAERGAPPEPLTWAQVEEMLSSGLVGVGSHSHSHTDFDTLDAERAEEECARSREILQRRLGVEVDAFAYPRAVVAHEDVVARHYRYAVAADGVKNLAGALEPLRLTRTPVRASDGVFFFRRRLDGAAPLEDRLYERMRGPGRRRGPGRLRGPGPGLIHVTTIDMSLAKLLANQLRRFREEGFDVAGASAPGPHSAELAAADIRFLPVPALTRSWSPLADVWALRQLYRLFRAERPAIVHTHNPKSGVLGRLAARAARVPVVVNTVHGLYANPALPPLRRALVDRAERWAMRFSDHELFQSAEDHALAMRTRMVRREHATLLGNGVNLGRFDPATVDPNAVTALRARWGALGGAVVVGSVGRLVREKGYEELFEAASLVGAQRGDVLFVIVGPEEPEKADGLTRASIEAARRAGIVFHGPGASREMPVVYAAFDLFALASHREGVPRSAIEAAAMARPVVATDIRGCREVVDEGSTGVLVPPRDSAALAAAVMGLAGDLELRTAMGKAGRERAIERFDEERVVERTLAVYRELLDARGIHCPVGGAET